MDVCALNHLDAGICLVSLETTMKGRNNISLTIVAVGSVFLCLTLFGVFVLGETLAESIWEVTCLMLISWLGVSAAALFHDREK
jgi:hypothetical protein